MNQKDLLQEIGQIRSMMEKSSKFMSISGMSGVVIGCVALVGAAAAYFTVYGTKSDFGYRDFYVLDEQVIWKLVGIALLVLLASIILGISMAKAKAKKSGQSIWNPTSKALLKAMAVPLVTGGLFSLILISKGVFGLIASSLLIFYGLSLAAASTYTFREVRVLGILEIVLGLLALAFPGYGIWFWSIGFGVLHILYGLIVHKKYEK
ncbi:hypothetical protein GCM10022216_09890 [Sphingobacterium kyonggiense]|uniref:Uncharacterized protein n=1 Tax=Sphingobacterium kyonggiense TaxID=714075 RepID=A0ABP7YG37_9SPHI